MWTALPVVWKWLALLAASRVNQNELHRIELAINALAPGPGAGINTICWLARHPTVPPLRLDLTPWRVRAKLLAIAAARLHELADMHAQLGLVILGSVSTVGLWGRRLTVVVQVAVERVVHDVGLLSAALGRLLTFLGSPWRLRILLGMRTRITLLVL